MSKKHFILTSFIHPLKEEYCFSEKYGFYFDNPRTEHEIQMVYEYVESCYLSDFNSWQKFPIKREGYEKFANLEDAVSEWFEFYSKRDSRFKKMKNYDNPILEISKIWVICRFDDFGESEKLENEKKEQGGSSFFILGDESTIVKQERRLLGFSSMLSLLLFFKDNLEANIPSNFLIDDGYYDVFRPSYNKLLVQAIHFWLLRSHPPNDNNISIFLDYKRFIKLASSISHRIETIIGSGYEELLIYIGESIRSCIETKDKNAALVRLVGIIEMLLTHSPDYNRFNVEDTISKQFLLKLSIVVYNFENHIDFKSFKANIKMIYTLRSNIAHGNFKELHKIFDRVYQEKIKVADDPAFISKEDILNDNIAILYKYIYYCLSYFFDNAEFMIFLKEN